MFLDVSGEQRTTMIKGNDRRLRPSRWLLAGWVSFSLVLVAGQGCSKDESKPGATPWVGTGGNGGGGAAGTAGVGAQGGAAGALTGGSAGNAGSELDGGAGDGGTAGSTAGAAGSIQDAAVKDAIDWDTYTKDGAVPDDQAAPTAPCAVAVAANHTKELAAGGQTPAGFASAFNSFNSVYGPLLLVFTGLDQTSDTARSALFGPAVMSENQFDFGSTPGATALTATAAKELYVPYTEVAFAIRLDDGKNSADVPAVAVEMKGQYDGSCAGLTLDYLRITIPLTSGGVAFAGSTIGALMGAPSTSWGSGSDNGWRLDLSGVATPVTYAGAKEAGP